MEFIYFSIIGLAIIIVLAGIGVIIHYSDDFSLIFKIGIGIILVIFVATGACLGFYELKDDNKTEITSYYSQGYIAGGKLVSSNELLPFEDGSYVKKSENNSDTYYIRVYTNDSGDFIEQTIEGELTYSYTTDKPHIEKYLSKEKTIISDEEYSYKIFIPKVNQSSENNSNN